MFKIVFGLKFLLQLFIYLVFTQKHGALIPVVLALYLLTLLNIKNSRSTPKV